MLFNSWPFLFVFLPIAFLGFRICLSHHSQTAKLWLIGCSLYFYSYWKLEFLPLLLISILCNYGIARLLHKEFYFFSRKWILILGLTFNLAALAYYKYANFLLSLLPNFSATPFHAMDIRLPLAISFFTFTQIAFLIDVYKDRTLTYSWIDYTFFVVFFPHLIAGPIVRHHEFIPQLKNWRNYVAWENIQTGLTLLTMGLVKKCFFSDSLAPHVEKVFQSAASGHVLSVVDSWVGTLAFSCQIYFDFSGYSDMALGLALFFGIHFPPNFTSPYQATSIIDFWSRWHMSLTRFMREYVYFSLGGNRVKPLRWVFNILVTMLLSGLWHGAGFLFIIWGGLHGIFLVISHRATDLLKPLQQYYGIVCRLFSHALTLIIIATTWVWFRADSIHTASQVLKSMFGLHGLIWHQEVTGRNLLLGLVPIWAIILFLPNTLQLLIDYKPSTDESIRPGWFRLRLSSFTFFILGIIFYFVGRELFTSKSNLFIYFKF